MDELQADLAQHAKTVHNYTDEQLTDPKTVEAIKATVKQE
jgi:predicted small metal-binding protein